MTTTNDPLSTTRKLRPIDTTSSSTSIAPSRSTNTSPIDRTRGGGVGEYVQSPESLYPTIQASTPRSRGRREGSPSTSIPTPSTTTVIGMNTTDDASSRNRKPLLHSSPSSRSDIPFIGGGFTIGQNGSTRPGLTKRQSISNGTNSILRARKGKCTRIIGLVAVVIVVWWVATSWTTEREPRRKLNQRWWEQEDQLSNEDLSALLPRPTFPTRPAPPKPPPPTPPHSHTLSQILKLPSTLSVSSPDFHSTNYTVLIHLTSSSQLLSFHLHPLLLSFTSQSPLPPSQIILLCPSGLEPQPSVLTSFSSSSSIKIETLSYSPPTESPLLSLSTSIVQNLITTEYLLIVDGHFPTTTATTSSGSGTGIGKDYVKTLLHAFGTKEYSSSILSAGGLLLSPSSSSSSATQEDTCIYPSSSSSSSSKPTTQRISIPSTPFLVPTSWFLPRSHTITSTSTSNEDQEITSTSPTILQGLPMTVLNRLPFLEIGLSWALWTKSGIPTYALPLPLSSSFSSSVSKDDGTGGGEKGIVDGWVCERFKRNLRRTGEDRVREEEGGGGIEDVRRGYGEGKGGGEGLRRIKGDRLKGGAVGKTAKVATTSTKEKNALERAREMKKGSFVLLLSGKEELDVIRGTACRFAAGGGSGGESNEFGDQLEESVGDRELRIVVADWNGREDQEWENRENGLCHLEITPLAHSAATNGGGGTEASISLPLIDMLDSTIDPTPAVVMYLSDGTRAREFEEVLKWMGGIFGVRKGGERVSRVRMEKESVQGGEGGKGRMTVIGIEREELSRADWIGALPIEALRHWHTPRIDVLVITNDRPVSLHRLLLSLRSAHYFGDDVSLALNLEQTTDRLTHRLVDDFRWNQGPLSLRHRILLGGLMPAIVESWYPTSNDTYGVLLEDDVEVSPLFYGWLKFTILKYRYTLAGRAASTRLFGISLYQQKNIELRPEGRQPFDAHKLFESLSLHSTSPYLSQIPCSWGAAYFPEMWREFHSYLSLRLSEIALPISEPIVPAIRSNRWPRSWKKYFIELVYLRGYTMLYPNYPGFESLSTNHLEKGTHVKTSQVEEKKKVLFEVPLLDVDGSLVDSLPRGQLPEWESLPVMDLWGSLASSEELIERGWQTTRQIGSCRALPDLETTRLKYDARELLCKKEWDRETEGRLVQARPLQERDRTVEAGLDEGRAGAAEVEREAIDETTAADAGGQEEGVKREREKREDVEVRDEEVKLVEEATQAKPPVRERVGSQ